MRKVYYVYNTKTHRYDRIYPTVRQRIRIVLRRGFWLLFVGLVCFLLALTSLPTLKVFVRVTIGIGDVIHIWNASALLVSLGFTSTFMQQN